MSLLQSKSCRTPHSRRAAPGYVARCATLGCLLFAGTACSFDVEPQAGARSDATREPGWMPPSAAGKGSSRARDAGSGSELDSAAAVPTARPDKGPAGSEAPRTIDAGAEPASEPAPMNERDDAAMQAIPPDNTRPDAGAPAEAPDAGNQQPPDAGTTSSRCKPGVYSGTFNGSIQLIGLSLSTVTGTVRTELKSDDANAHLALRDARVVGVDQDGNPLTVELSGVINCESLQLEDGRLERGNLHNNNSDTDTAFTGKAQAMYSQDPHSVVGNWTVEATDTAALLTGKGTWSLILEN
jgi:hypothetical protein